VQARACSTAARCTDGQTPPTEWRRNRRVGELCPLQLAARNPPPAATPWPRSRSPPVSPAAQRVGGQARRGKARGAPAAAPPSGVVAQQANTAQAPGQSQHCDLVTTSGAVLRNQKFQHYWHALGESGLGHECLAGVWEGAPPPRPTTRPRARRSSPEGPAASRRLRRRPQRWPPRQEGASPFGKDTRSGRVASVVD
jgi:hypothetical protein